MNAFPRLYFGLQTFIYSFTLRLFFSLKRFCFLHIELFERSKSFFGVVSDKQTLNCKRRFNLSVLCSRTNFKFFKASLLSKSEKVKMWSRKLLESMLHWSEWIKKFFNEVQNALLHDVGRKVFPHTSFKFHRWGVLNVMLVEYISITWV